MRSVAATLFPGDLVEIHHPQGIGEMWWYVDEYPAENPLSVCFYLNKERVYPKGRSICVCLVQPIEFDTGYMYIRAASPEHGFIVGKTWGNDCKNGTVTITKVETHHEAR